MREHVNNRLESSNGNIQPCIIGIGHINTTITTTNTIMEAVPDKLGSQVNVYSRIRIKGFINNTTDLCTSPGDNFS